MTTKKAKPVLHSSSADTTAAVDAFMRALDHRFKQEIETIRRLILGADPIIAEGIKWNSPSFRAHEYFATINLREKKGIGLVLHLGARVKEFPAGGLRIEDPKKLLKWLGQNRAVIVFADAQDLHAKKAALAGLIRHWIAHV